MPVTNSPGLVYSFLLKSTGKKTTPRSGGTIQISSPFHPWKNYRYQLAWLTRWFVDIYETCDRNLERICSENIWPTYGTAQVRTQHRCFFWHVFGSIWFLQLWEEKSLELIMSVSICASGQGTKNFDRYHEFQVFIYSILNEIISSTIVYDQDANRSRGLY